MPSCSWRTLLLPSGDRAHWHPTGAMRGPLLYLAWGARSFGTEPIATTLHDGWVYAVVEKGGPMLVRESTRGRIAAPALLMIGPDCASGWSDDPRRSSRLLVWMWRRPRHPALKHLDPAMCTRLSLDKEDLALLGNLHALSRREAQLGDRTSTAALTGLQLLVEAQLARVLERKEGGREKAVVSRARQWLEQHLDSRQPLARLADYLALSPSTVQRLFRQRLGQTVLEVVAELRCREATRMIAEEGMPIKAVAYRLGYHHPHDFSRAYRRLTGKNPSTLGAPPDSGRKRTARE